MKKFLEANVPEYEKGVSIKNDLMEYNELKNKFVDFMMTLLLCIGRKLYDLDITMEKCHHTKPHTTG